MDRHKTQTNRHKKKEEFKSGSAKRKIAEEKEKKNEEVIAKSRRMTDYIVKYKPTSNISSENYEGLDNNVSALSSASPNPPKNLEEYEVVS